MRKLTWMPVAFLLVGAAFYIYYGVTYNAWKENLSNLIVYIIIIIGLFLAHRKKEQLRREREERENN